MRVIQEIARLSRESGLFCLPIIRPIFKAKTGEERRFTIRMCFWETEFLPSRRTHRLTVIEPTMSFLGEVRWRNI